MKIAICDDLKFDRTILCQYILKYAQNALVNIDTVQFDCGEDLLSAYANESFKIIFLDIYMKGISGVAVAEKIRETDEECKIIFTTSSQKYTGEGFEVAATHYLVKPITYERVEQALNRCKHVLSTDAKYIELAVNKEIFKIRLKEIFYVEAVRNGVIVTTSCEILKVHNTMLNIEAILTDNRFVRCHRGFIVNMEHVASLDEDKFRMSNGNFIPIRQFCRRNIRNTFIEYKLKK